MRILRSLSWTVKFTNVYDCGICVKYLCTPCRCWHSQSLRQCLCKLSSRLVYLSMDIGFSLIKTFSYTHTNSILYCRVTVHWVSQKPQCLERWSVTVKGLAQRHAFGSDVRCCGWNASLSLSAGPRPTNTLEVEGVIGPLTCRVMISLYKCRDKEASSICI